MNSYYLSNHNITLINRLDNSSIGYQVSENIFKSITDQLQGLLDNIDLYNELFDIEKIPRNQFSLDLSTYLRNRGVLSISQYVYTSQSTNTTILQVRDINNSDAYAYTLLGSLFRTIPIDGMRSLIDGMIVDVSELKSYLIYCDQKIHSGFIRYDGKDISFSKQKVFTQ